MTSVFRLWRGEIPLPSAFWNWAVFGGIVVNGASSAAFLLLILVDRPISAFIAGYVPSIPYNILVTVGVWRAAERYEGEGPWADVAKFATVVGMILMSVT